MNGHLEDPLRACGYRRVWFTPHSPGHLELLGRGAGLVGAVGICCTGAIERNGVDPGIRGYDVSRAWIARLQGDVAQARHASCLDGGPTWTLGRGRPDCRNRQYKGSQWRQSDSDDIAVRCLCCTVRQLLYSGASPAPLNFDYLEPLTVPHECRPCVFLSLGRRLSLVTER